MNGKKMAAAIQNLPDDIASDLVTTNELGNGERDYRVEGDELYVDLYQSDRIGPDGFPIPDVTYRVGISLTLVDDSGDRSS